MNEDRFGPQTKEFSEILIQVDQITDQQNQDMMALRDETLSGAAWSVAWRLLMDRNAHMDSMLTAQFLSMYSDHCSQPILDAALATATKHYLPESVYQTLMYPWETVMPEIPVSPEFAVS